MTDKLDIPDFLKRSETEDQAEARRKKSAPKDHGKGLKVKKLPDPKDPKIAAAIARDLKDPKDGDHFADWQRTQDSLRKAQAEHHRKPSSTDKVNAKLAAEEKKILAKLVTAPKKAGKLVERALKVREEMKKHGKPDDAKHVAAKSASKPKGAEKSAAKSASPKKKTIGSVASEAILAGDDNEQALKKVMKAFPDCSSNVGCMAWYRNKLRKEGKIRPKQAVR